MDSAFGTALLGISLLSLSVNAYAHAASFQTNSALSKATAAKSRKASSVKPAASSPKSGPSYHKTATRYSRRAAPRPSYQLHPDPERYQQIQQALADRGYFKGQINGEWGDDSVDALKRFQADQKLEDDGKISALTLIGLGLGPTHSAAVSSAANATATPASEIPNVPPTPDESSAPPR